MNSRAGNTLQFQQFPISSHAQALEASLLPQRLSAFYWIDNSAPALYLHATVTHQTARGKLLRSTTA
jgi:hypothetical protein